MRTQESERSGRILGHRIREQGGLGILVFAALSPLVQSQPTSLTVTHLYPRSSCSALVSEPDAPGSGVDLVYAGTGGQIAPINGDAANPGIWTGADDDMYAHGSIHDLTFVRDSVMTGRDRLYSASGRGGVTCVDLSASQYQIQFIKGGNTSDYARSVAAIDIATSTVTRRIVIVGTNEGEASGVIRVYEHSNAGSSLSELGVYPSSGTTGPVYTLHAALDLTSSPTKLTLLAGTACAGLLRFDIDLAEFDGTTFTLANYLTSTWVPSTGSAMIRDIVVNKTEKIAFVAAHSRGIYAFDVDGSGTLSALGSPWPILPSLLSPNNAPNERFDGVALSPDGGFLVAALGPAFFDEFHHWGLCTQKLGCDGAPKVPTPTNSGRGVRVYDIDGGSGYATIADVVATHATTQAGGKLFPLAVDTRPGSASGKFFIDIAAESEGVVIIEFDTNVSPRSFVPSGERVFGIYDEMLIGAVDDVWTGTIAGQTVGLFAFEKGLAAFNISGGVLGTPSSIDLTVAVLLSVNPSFDPPYAVGGSDGGAYLFDLSTPLAPDGFPGVFNSSGHGHVNVEAITSPADVDPAEPWAWVVNKDEEYSTVTEGPGVRVWDLSTPIVTNNLSTARIVANYIDEHSFSGTPVNRTFGGISVLSITNEKQIAWVGFGPDKRLVDQSQQTIANPSTTIGLLVLELTYIPGTGVSIVRVPQGGSGLDDPAVTGLTGNEPLGRATRYGTSEVYMAYGCYGVAKFNISNPTAPTFSGHRASPSGASAIQAVRIGDYVYTSYLGTRYITAELASSFGSGTVYGPLKTPHGSVNIAEAPGGGAFFGADGRGGAIRFTLQ